MASDRDRLPIAELKAEGLHGIAIIVVHQALYDGKPLEAISGQHLRVDLFSNDCVVGLIGTETLRLCDLSGDSALQTFD